MLEWAEPPKTCSASVGWTPRAPFFKYRMYCSSALQTPPSAVPKLTPMRACGFSLEHSSPASSKASLADATANCAYRSSRFRRCGEKNSSGCQSRISPATRTPNALASKLVIGPIPVFSARMPFQKSSTPLPMQVIGPRPVITQRRCPSFVENMWLASRFQIRFHASKGAIGNMADKKVANDRLHQWRQGADTEVQVVCDFDENTGRGFLEGPDHEHALGESLQVMK